MGIAISEVSNCAPRHGSSSECSAGTKSSPQLDGSCKERLFLQSHLSVWTSFSVSAQVHVCDRAQPWSSPALQLITQGALKHSQRCSHGYEGPGWRSGQQILLDLRNQLLYHITPVSHTYITYITHTLSARFSHHLRCHNAQLT